MVMVSNDKAGKEGHMNVNRRKLLASMGVTGVTGFAGCTGDDGDDSGEEVHFITDESNPEFQEFFERVGEEFQEETGVEARIEILQGGGGVEERLAQLIQAGDPPEVAFSGASQVTRFVNNDVAGATTPAVEWAMERYGEPPESYRAIFDGEDYILPLWANVVQFWYRSDIYDDEPNTWEKVQTQVEKHHGTNDINGTMVATSENLCTESAFISWFYTNGGRVFTRSNGELELAIDGEHKTAAVETLEHLNQLYEYSPNTTDFGCEDQSDSVPNTTSLSHTYIGSRAKLKSIRRGREFAADVDVVDGMPEKEAKESFALSEGLITFEQANTELANDFMKFMIHEDRINELLFATPIHNNPIWPGMVESGGYQQRLDELPDEWSDSTIEKALGYTEYGIPLASEVDPPNPYTGAALASRGLARMVFDVLEGGKDPEAAVDENADVIREAVENARN